MLLIPANRLCEALHEFVSEKSDEANSLKTSGEPRAPFVQRPSFQCEVLISDDRQM